MRTTTLTCAGRRAGGGGCGGRDFVGRAPLPSGRQAAASAAESKRGSPRCANRARQIRAPIPNTPMMMFGHHRARYALVQLAVASCLGFLDRAVMPARLGGADFEDRVVGEHHGEADDEAGHLGVARRGQAKREADHRKHETGDRDREFLLGVDDLGMRREPFLEPARAVRPQLRDGLFGDGPRQFLAARRLSSDRARAAPARGTYTCSISPARPLV